MDLYPSIHAINDSHQEAEPHETNRIGRSDTLKPEKSKLITGLERR